MPRSKTDRLLSCHNILPWENLLLLFCRGNEFLFLTLWAYICQTKGTLRPWLSVSRPVKPVVAMFVVFANQVDSAGDFIDDINSIIVVDPSVLITS
jgi:hypothetical protein